MVTKTVITLVFSCDPPGQNRKTAKAAIRETFRLFSGTRGIVALISERTRDKIAAARRKGVLGLRRTRLQGNGQGAGSALFHRRGRE
jgi:hypothetical protein